MLLGEPAVIKEKVENEAKCEENKSKTPNPKIEHVMGGPTVKRDTAAINKNSKRVAEKLVKELGPKIITKEKVNEIAPGKLK